MIIGAAVLLLALIAYDLRKRRLPNGLVAAYAALCPFALIVAGAAPSVWLQHGVVALSGFIVLTTMFVMGGMGGGDVKLGTAVLGWAGMQSLVPSLVVIAIVGLLLAVLGVLADWLPTPSRTSSNVISRAWRMVVYALSARRGVPYGVALALGGMIALPAYW